jgi:hypothetical protein
MKRVGRFKRRMVRSEPRGFNEDSVGHGQQSDVFKPSVVFVFERFIVATEWPNQTFHHGQVGNEETSVGQILEERFDSGS